MLSGCGGDSASSEVAIDNTEEVQEYYRTFKRPPLELKAQLASGAIDQEEYNRQMESVEPFYQFKTIEDLPEGLLWERGEGLPEIGSSEAKKGGTAYGALQDFPRTLRRVGPDANGSFRPYILDDVAMRIARRHPNDTSIGPRGHYYFPELAEEWAVDFENKTVYVRLDPEARFSDGEPVTSDDFMFMFFFFQSSYIRAPWYNNWYVESYTGITKYDDHTFSISVPEAKPDMNSRVLDLIPVPEHFFKELGDDYVERYQWRFQPTTGAYVIKEDDIKKGRSISLTRQKDWWAKDKKNLRYRYNPDRIHLTVIRDIPKMFESFKRGDLDATGLVNLPEYNYEKLPDDDPDVQAGYIHKVTFYNEIPRPTYGLWINTAKPLLDDVHVRRGINYATNWNRVIEEYFRGDNVRMNTTADGYGEFTHPTMKARPFDVDKALAEFAKAGFAKRGPDGILVNDEGQRLSFTLSTGYRTFQDMLTIVKEEAMKAGLEFRLEVLDGTAGWKMAQEKKHDITFSALGVSPEMYPRYWETYHADNAYDVPWLPDGVTPNPDRKIKTQTNNLQSVADPELDALIMAYRRSDDAEEMKKLAFRMEEILYDNASFCPGFVNPSYRVAFWRWVRYPDDFNVKLSASAGEWFVSWLDQDLKKETLEARKSGKTFEPVIKVYDQYAPQSLPEDASLARNAP
ncbi:ABC transporter substrate-binding protein [Puniceicoccales bacterium CK1056]|uniref:ABC transporter substrate-binding protein n=2 Tax=Oceanipulchritudo coccoides TaxID=2706888 RepID=A0A6B2M5B2_9BACT|nr:ABC transporter substrate-binding protein [Oceanipulchritudo coccoides]